MLPFQRLAKIPREQFPRSNLVADVTRMSLTCHEEIGRVGRVRRGCYEETARVEFKLYIARAEAHLQLLAPRYGTTCRLTS